MEKAEYKIMYKFVKSFKPFTSQSRIGKITDEHRFCGLNF